MCVLVNTCLLMTWCACTFISAAGEVTISLYCYLFPVQHDSDLSQLPVNKLLQPFLDLKSMNTEC